jgi:succinate-acetate transporter protein
MPNHEHPFAAAAPAGLMVLTFYLSCLFPIMNGLASPEMETILIPLGLAGGIVQLTAGIIELRCGMIVPGNIMCGFSAFMFLGMGENLLKVLNLMPQHTAAGDGYIFLIMGIYMAGFTLPFLMKNLVAGIFMITTDIFFLGLGISWIFGIPILTKIAAWSIAPIVITAAWQAIAEVLNTQLGSQVIKMGPPLITVKNK